MKKNEEDILKNETRGGNLFSVNGFFIQISIGFMVQKTAVKNFVLK